MSGIRILKSMRIEESTLSPAQSPKWEIPDIWAENGHCPACGATNLKATHLPDHPDYLSCARCGISFEVENGGRYIRLKYIPDAYESIDAVVHNRWVEASRLSAIISQRRVPASERKTAPPVQELSDEDAWNRALGMYRLGNKPKMIQLTLMQSGVTRERAEAIFVKLQKVAEQDARRQNQKFWILAGVSVFVIFALAGGWLYASGNLAVLMGKATPVPTANKPSTVELLLDLVPDDAKPAIVDLPDTVVEVGRGPGRASCPPTAGMAAELFGGSSTMWQQPGAFAAWQMTNPIDSITVSVPANMTAAYVDNKSMQFLSVYGPATIYNVNFLVISCE